MRRPGGPSAGKYDCASGPANNSFRNTGQATLPPAQPAWIRYAGDAGSPPEFGGGSESPMAGPVYNFDANLDSAVKFPASLDGRFWRPYLAGDSARKVRVTVRSEDPEKPAGLAELRVEANDR
ncbi:hypothetical protein ACZ90_70865 [Streptomyces albus subsp. albus]|nr:hypothetical protein ACZ90_70865 [Streptomyces albus subsp. albus]